MPITYKQGARSTTTLFAQNDNIRVVGVDGMLIRRDIGPLTTLLIEGLKKSGKKGQASTKIEWKESDFMAQWVTLSAAVVDGAVATITVTDPLLVTAGDILYVPPANATLTMGEKMRATSGGSNPVSVTRGFAGTTAAAVANGVALSIESPAINEGAAAPEAKSVIPVTNSAFMQHFVKTKKLTLEQAASGMYGAPNGLRKELHTQLLNEMKLSFNRTCYWGVGSEDLAAAGGELRTQSGLREKIVTNVTDAGGLLTYKTFMDFAERAFQYHDADSELGLLSPGKLINAINAWGNANLMVGPEEKIYGVNTRTVQTGFGRFRLIYDKALETQSGQTRGFGHIAFAVDFSNVEIVFLQGNGESFGEPAIAMDVVKDGSGKYVDLARMICGLKVKHEKKHSVIQNITDYTAPF